MTKYQLLNTIGVICFCLAATASNGQSLVEQLDKAVADGDIGLSLRYRSETVVQDNALRDALASTLLTRLTLTSGQVNGFSALLEMDNVSTIGSDRYDSLVQDKYRGHYSVVADPSGAEINQALIKYNVDATRSVTLGMQRILHAGQRFIGGVGWRQNEQTFDALSWQSRSERFDLDYSYLWNVNRIFAGARPSVQLSNLESASHIALGSYKTDFGVLSGYAYLLDFTDASNLSSETYGVSFATHRFGFNINASIALQSDYGDNPLSYEAEYLAFDIGRDFGAAVLQLGYELLGSDDGVVAFNTPLATLHLWQGWADLFLTTPANGIEDRFLTLSGKIGAASVAASYHRFSADEGGMDYGREWDLIATYPLRSNLSAQLKYSTYDSDSHAVDTDKLWFMLTLSL